MCKKQSCNSGTTSVHSSLWNYISEDSKSRNALRLRRMIDENPAIIRSYPNYDTLNEAVAKGEGEASLER